MTDNEAHGQAFEHGRQKGDAEGYARGKAEAVKHGQWIFKHDPLTDPKKYFIRIVCSECNLHTGQKSNYCPNCGADMRGGDDGA